MKDFDLKSALFVRAMEALTAYQTAINTKYPSPEAERWHDRFHALYQVIQDCRLVDEFDNWKEG